jgi:hypothetical protein
MDRPDERARLAIILQRIVPDLAASLWRVRNLHELPITWREEVADVLGCEAAAHGLDENEVPTMYGIELGELPRARLVTMARYPMDPLIVGAAKRAVRLHGTVM